MIKKAVAVRLPTSYGEFQLHAYSEGSDRAATHLALVKGDPKAAPTALVRIHSECLTGDLLASTRCDCGEQLDAALRAISEQPCGVLVYLRQEGRGIGLLKKLEAYNLQDTGLDTVDANLELGFDADLRDYSIALEILRDLGVRAVELLTNNPAKLSVFDDSDIVLTARVPLVILPTHENQDYLDTKRRRFGHLFDGIVERGG